MAMRHSWQGYLQLSLISIPVYAYNAAISGQGEIHFHQIHKGCGGRVRYKKVCEIHGEELTRDEIASGYEYQKGMHIEIEPDEIKAVRADKDELITIDTFVAPDKIDAIHFTGRTFYLVPDGPAGRKSYDLLVRAMKAKRRHAIASIVLSGHEEVVLIRPIKDMLVMSVLYLEVQLKNSADFAGDIGQAPVSKQELKLATSLIDATTVKLDFSKFKDKYTERVQELLDAKLAGRRIEPHVAGRIEPAVDIVEALRKSLKKAGGESRGGRKSSRKPAARRRAG